jgi:tetratricopeptide (TPR) repeat protein
MELVHGDPLSRSYHKLSMARALEVVQEVTEALAAAHRVGIIHRDIKPGNIMINDRDEVKVLDFGLAKRIGEPVSITLDSVDLTLTNQLSAPGNIAGTPQYMSPEQASGDHVDARTDLFSVGIVLYECLTGIVPFPGRELREILMRVKTLDPPPPSKQNPMVPPELDRIVGKALKKLPAERYQTADELSADLRAARSSMTDAEAATLKHTLSEPDTKATRVVDTVRKTARYTVQTVLRKPVVAVPVLLAVLGVVALFFFGVGPKLRDPDLKAKKDYEFGLQSLREEAYYRASRALESAAANDPSYPLTHLRLADVWLQLDQDDKAKNELLQVTGLLPGLQKLSGVESLYHQAINLMVNGRFVDAVHVYRELVGKAPQEEQLHALLSLGKALEKSGQPKEETKTYLEAANRFDAACAWLRLATSYARQGQAEEAKRAFDAADKRYDAQSDIEGKTEVAYQRGLYHLRRSNIAEADRDLSRALELAQTLQKATPNADRSQEILAKIQLGDVASLEKKPDVAAIQVSEALKLAEDNNLERLAARALIKLGNQALFAGRHTPEDDLVTEGYFNRALRTSRKINGAKLLEAQSYLGLASLRQQQGRSAEEEQYLKNPIDLVAFFSDSGYVSEELAARSLVARLVRDSGNYDESIKAFRYLLQRAKEVSNREFEIRSQIDLVKVLAMKEDYRNAIAGGSESYDLAKSLGIRFLLSYIVADRSDREWKLGLYAEAERALKELESDPKPQPQLHAQVLLTRAEMELSRNQLASAINYAQSAQKALPEDAETEIHSKEVIGLAKIRSGLVREGRQFCEEAAKRAEQEKKAWLTDPTIVALSEALTAARDPRALTVAAAGAKRFTDQGQADSAWRCCLFSALAAQIAGDRQNALSFVKLGQEQLKRLESTWVAADYQSYINRPDIRMFLNKLNQLEAQVK